CRDCLQCMSDCAATPGSNQTECPDSICSNAAPEPVPAGAPGGLLGQSEVTSDGAFTYTLPLDVPDGRNGMQPSLALSYNSRGGNGLLGMGWSLGGLSSITRCGRTIAVDGYTDGVHFDSSDALCLDGERLVAVNGTSYGMAGSEYRTEHESFRKVVAY